MKKRKMNAQEIIDYINFQEEINLNWEEKLSMDKSEGLITFKNAKKEYKRIRIETFKKLISFAISVDIAYNLSNIISDKLIEK